jgi:tetratricopeptide (TPR) repeat protein
MPDQLRALWDFDDLDATHTRFRGALEREASDPRRAEILTQLARIDGLRGDVEGSERLLIEAEHLAGEDRHARTRIALERGRLRNSSGDLEEARFLFAEAFELAMGAGDRWLAADAAHMAEIAAADDAERETWTERGLDAATSSPDPEDAYWAGPILNNLGWARYEAGRYPEALEAFRAALEARERDPDRPDEIEIARYAVGKTLRALGRPAQAAELLERATAWADGRDMPDGWFHEELAEDYTAVGRRKEAAEHAATALDLLPDQDPTFRDDAPRAERLREIQAGRG